MKKLPISIHPMFWLFAALIGWFNSGSLAGTIIWVVIIFVSVLVHELGHALFGLAFKQRVHIHLVMFGGLTYRDGPKISKPKEFVLTLAGPVFGFAWALVAYGLLHAVGMTNRYLMYGLSVTFVVNVFWSIVNLIPVLPLDGGHLLRIVLEAIFKTKGTSIALIIGCVLGGMLGVFFLVVGHFLIGALFFLLAFDSFRMWQSSRHMTEQDSNEDLQDLYRQASEAHGLGEEARAKEGFERIRELAPRGMLNIGATEGLARIAYSEGDNGRAYSLLTPIKDKLSVEMIPLFHKLAFKAKDFKVTAALSKNCFQVSPTYETAFRNGLAHAALSQVRPALGWLECAIREGVPNPKAILERHELDPIRSDPKFQHFAAKLAQK